MRLARVTDGALEPGPAGPPPPGRGPGTSSDGPADRCPWASRAATTQSPPRALGEVGRSVGTGTSTKETTVGLATRAHNAGMVSGPDGRASGDGTRETRGGSPLVSRLFSSLTRGRGRKPTSPEGLKEPSHCHGTQ